MFHILQGMNLGQLALLAETDLRGRLTDQLVRGCAECMVCLERVRQHQATWDCHNCYQVNIFFIYLYGICISTEYSECMCYILPVLLLIHKKSLNPRYFLTYSSGYQYFNLSYFR